MTNSLDNIATHGPKLLLVVLVCLLAPHLGAQKLLQLERAGSTKLTRFYIGDEITFTLRNDDKGWYTRVITDIDIESEELIFLNTEMPIDSIAEIRLYKSGFWPFMGTALQAGGGGIVLSSLSISIIQGTEFPTAAVISGAASYGIGTALKQWKYKKFKIGSRKRLRVLDLSFRIDAPPDR